MAHRSLAVVLTLVVWMVAVPALTVLTACGGKSGGAKDPDAPVGKVTAVVGEVSVRRAAGAPQAATVGLAVTRDMVFKTGADASLEVRFDNNYTWKLAEERERTIATLRVVDLPVAASAQSVEDDLAGNEQDRTTGAGRHAEQTAAEGASTVEKPTAAAEATGSPRAAPDKPLAPEIPVIVEESADDGEAAKAEPKRAAARKGAAAAPAAPPPSIQPAPAPAPPPPPKPALDGESGGGPGTGGGSSGGGSVGSGGKRAEPGAADVAIAKQVLAKKREDVQACGEQHAATGRLSMLVSIDASGKVTRVEVKGAYAGKPAGKCAADVVRAMTFPALTGATTLTYTFDLAK